MLTFSFDFLTLKMHYVSSKRQQTPIQRRSVTSGSVFACHKASLRLSVLHLTACCLALA
jgi:hypothetical protein